MTSQVWNAIPCCKIRKRDCNTHRSMHLQRCSANVAFVGMMCQANNDTVETGIIRCKPLLPLSKSINVPSRIFPPVRGIQSTKRRYKIDSAIVFHLCVAEKAILRVRHYTQAENCLTVKATSFTSGADCTIPILFLSHVSAEPATATALK